VVARFGTEKSKCKLSDVVSLAALVITLTTALLYFLGSTYYSAYLSYWGLPEELFSLSRDKSVLSGIFAYALICARELLHPLVNLVLLAEALLVVAVLCSVRCIKNFLVNRIRKLFRQITPHFTRHVDMSDDINRFIIGMLAVASPLLLTFAIVKSSQWAVNQGKEVGKTEYRKILSGSESKKASSSQAILYVKNDAKCFDLYSGNLITTSATHCALYRKKQGVNIFPLTSVARIIIHEDSVDAK
jgi:hypothetical protein